MLKSLCTQRISAARQGRMHFFVSAPVDAANCESSQAARPSSGMRNSNAFPTPWAPRAVRPEEIPRLQCGSPLPAVRCRANTVDVLLWLIRWVIPAFASVDPGFAFEPVGQTLVKGHCTIQSTFGMSSPRAATSVQSMMPGTDGATQAQNPPASLPVPVHRKCCNTPCTLRSFRSSV